MVLTWKPNLGRYLPDLEPESNGHGRRGGDNVVGLGKGHGMARAPLLPSSCREELHSPYLTGQCLPCTRWFTRLTEAYCRSHLRALLGCPPPSITSDPKSGPKIYPLCQFGPNYTIPIPES